MSLTQRVATLFSPRRSPVARAGDPPQEIRVRVKGGYEPDTIAAEAGRPLRITFRREETAACSEQVVFPAFGKSATLPPLEDVTLELLPEEPGEYEFTCRMGMLRGRVVVSAPSEAEGSRP